ncbi:LysR family transcriptional regulator [Sabulicella rubraurantiaca]|uniref:LysR family transcriptional regulator n=1 Tax=Sabulicella rubraurantiaca TaxID=2811429 RepID=UPI001A962073|nr:LysR family transcriptional regulator [Sabulicella rubraurantiaca]
MDLTQIRYFLAVAEMRNFTRAAERCNVTQPALTRAVQRLEDELGGPLILRERALTQLTERGRAMLPLLQQTLAAAEAVKAGATGFARRNGPMPLRVGVERCLPVGALLPLLREVLSHVREVEVSIAEDAPEELAEALLQGRIDVALLPEIHVLPERLQRWRLWTQRIAVLLPEGHPLAGREEVGAEELRGERLLPPATPAAGAVMERLCPAREAPRAPHGAGASAAGLEALVALGLGVALAPEEAPRLPGCAVRPLRDEAAAQPVVLAVPAGRPMNQAVSAFVRLARARRWERETA